MPGTLSRLARLPPKRFAELVRLLPAPGPIVSRRRCLPCSWIAAHSHLRTPGELRKAEWLEFDLERAEWRIPAERMKMKEMHIVPLSSQAVIVLRELHALTGGQHWLFANQRRPREHMSSTTLNRALERMKFNGAESRDFSAHGFRATASTMLNELGFRPDVIERQLAHKERNQVRRSYNHAEYLVERREMMQAWADQVDAMASGKSNVVPLRQTA